MEDTVVEERLILKFLNPNVSSDEEMMKRFVHELRYSRKITHKNVIRIYDFLYIRGNYAISMEYFPSHTLGGEIVNEKPVELKRAVKFGIDIATGMAVAHQAGIVHRDLKPANVLIDNDGLLKIVDFGVAAAQSQGDTQLTKTGYVIGSPKYMAPEQILGKKVDERADIYSLGVILYEMFAGVPPYSRGDHMSVMYQHVQGKARPPIEINKSLPVELNNLVMKCMSLDKTKRAQSMDELRHRAREVPLERRVDRLSDEPALRRSSRLRPLRFVGPKTRKSKCLRVAFRVMARIDAFLKLGVAQGCSDLHLAVGVPPMLRMHGDLDADQVPRSRRGRARELYHGGLQPLADQGAARGQRSRLLVRVGRRRPLSRQCVPQGDRDRRGVSLHSDADAEHRSARTSAHRAQALRLSPGHDPRHRLDRHRQDHDARRR